MHKGVPTTFDNEKRRTTKQYNCWSQTLNRQESRGLQSLSATVSPLGKDTMDLKL